jgi:hypothetical protein
MRDFIYLTFVVQIIISIFLYFGARGRHEVDSDGVDIFRINPPIAWMITIMSFAIAALLGYGVVTSKPTAMDAPLGIMLGHLLFFFFGLYGIYCITMRIRVDAQSIRVRSVLPTRIIYFRDIGSSTDKVTGRYRTFEILSMRGKRVLLVTSSFLPDYDQLVNVVQTGIHDHQSSLSIKHSDK